MEKKELCGDGSVKGCSHPRTKILLYGNQGDGGSWTVHTLILTKVLLFRNFSIRLTENTKFRIYPYISIHVTRVQRPINVMMMIDDNHDDDNADDDDDT